jgi:hypothetical protein
VKSITNCWNFSAVADGPPQTSVNSFSLNVIYFFRFTTYYSRFMAIKHSSLPLCAFEMEISLSDKRCSLSQIENEVFSFFLFVHKKMNSLFTSRKWAGRKGDLFTIKAKPHCDSKAKLAEHKYKYQHTLK